MRKEGRFPLEACFVFSIVTERLFVILFVEPPITPRPLRKTKVTSFNRVVNLASSWCCNLSELHDKHGLLQNVLLTTQYYIFFHARLSNAN